jgi:formamidase
VPKHHLSVDVGTSICQAPRCAHNRWHPDLTPALHIAPGDVVAIETRDALDGQIRPGMPAAELASISLDGCHPLTGPITIDGAQPGDLLAVHIQEVLPAKHGFTAVFPGFGLLREDFSQPFLLQWELSGGFATCEQLPGVYIPAAPFMGVMGLAPSRELLDQIQARELDLQRRGGFVFLPEPHLAVPDVPRVATEGLRTIAPREVGGNIDIKNLVAGSTLYLPVSAPGGLFSTGDAHFAQGNGESCGTAVETSATLVARFELLKGEAHRRGQRTPTFSGTHPTQVSSGAYFATTGIPIDRGGRNATEDLALAARNAIRSMIEHIVCEYGFTPEQAYCLTSVCVDLQISQAVNVPHALVCAFLSTAVFNKPQANTTR